MPAMDDVFTVMARFVHVTAGIFWIGLLYYFNVVQAPVFKRFDAGTRSHAIQKLVPVALAWFRYAALFTVLFGLALLYLIGRDHPQGMGGYMGEDAGAIISWGMAIGLVMFANVWLVIWPNQKRIINANVAKASQGTELPPQTAAWAKQAFLASRINFLLSFPMLFYMVGATHGIEVGLTRNEVLLAGLGVFVLGAGLLWLFTTARVGASKPTPSAPTAPPKP